MRFEGVQDALQLVGDVQLVRVEDQDDPINSGSEPVNPDQTGLKHLSFGRINFSLVLISNFSICDDVYAIIDLSKNHLQYFFNVFIFRIN